MFDGLADSDAIACRRAVRNGRYHLMLGAGASLGSTDSLGRPLPGAAGLAEELSTEFRVPLEDGDLLWRIYARCVERRGAEEVYAWLRARFDGCVPPAWMFRCANAPWEMVWTLNLDDSFERAYIPGRSDMARKLAVVSWDDQFRMQTAKQLTVVHLHGHVQDAAARSLVFSLSEYAEAMVARAAWPITFRDLYGASPFVIIGARLRDEPDIETVIAGRRRAVGAPSFYVNPHITAAMEADLRAWGLVPVRATAEEFMQQWGQFHELALENSPDSSEEIALRIGNQFRELRLDTPKRPEGHDFLGGDEPFWRDILTKEYAPLAWMDNITSWAKASDQGRSATSAIVMTGNRLSGRSTGALHLGREFLREGWRLFEFRAHERPDVEAIVNFCSNNGSVALMFDGCADIADDIAETLRRGRDIGAEIVCIATDTTYRAPNILGRIPTKFLGRQQIHSIPNRLNRGDAGRLVDHLEKRGRLGRLEPLRDSARVRHFVGHEIFDALADISDAPGFGRRVADLVDSIDNDDLLRLVFFAALADRAERNLLIIDAARLLAMDSDKVVALVATESAGSLLRVEDDTVSTRQRYMALAPTISRLGEAEALRELADALSRLGVRVGRPAQRERNAAALLMGSLMSYRVISDVFPHQNFEDWYSSLNGAFGGWSGRYWEQRAIASRHMSAADEGALARSESYARRAVSIVPDTYSYTTLGTVLAARAANARGAEVVRYYDDMYDAFDAASNDDPTNLVTWIAFLRHTLPIVERLEAMSWEESDDFKRRVHEDWEGIKEYLSNVASASEQLHSEVMALSRRFKLATR